MQYANSDLRNINKFILLLFSSLIGFVPHAKAYGPEPHQRDITSPNGQIRANAAPYTGQPHSVHYRLTSTDGSGRVYFDTRAQFKEPNDVKAGAFSPDSRSFAAAYHYSGEGGYTWVGVWDANTGTFIRSLQKPGYVRDVSDVFIYR